MTLNDFINEVILWSAGVHAKKTTDANSLALRKFALKELLGHSQIQTTQIYSNLTQSHLEAESNKVRF